MSGRCKQCARRITRNWKQQNRRYHREQKKRGRERKMLLDRDAVYRRIWALRAEADRLEELLNARIEEAVR